MEGCWTLLSLLSLVGPHGQTNKVFVLHIGLSSHIPVPSSEAVCQSLDVDTNNNKVVQGQLTGPRVVLGQQVRDKRGREPVTHLLQSLGQLCLLYEATTVSVNALEQTLPLVDVGKQTGELLDVDLTAPVPVEHVHHHPAGLFAEVAPVTVDQSFLQFIGVDLSTSVLVNSVKPLCHCRINLTWENKTFLGLIYP